jgi:hypothetical protein
VLTLSGLLYLEGEPRPLECSPCTLHNVAHKGHPSTPTVNAFGVGAMGLLPCTHRVGERKIVEILKTSGE